MKRGLSKSPLTAMKLSFARQQAFAQQSFRSLKSQALHEVLAVSYQDLFDQIRMIQKVRILRSQLEKRNIAVVLGEFLKVGQRPPPIIQQARERNSVTRAWRYALAI